MTGIANTSNERHRPVDGDKLAPAFFLITNGADAAPTRIIRRSNNNNNVISTFNYNKSI